MPDGAVTTAKRRGLAQRRKAVGLTQEQLAERLGVERTTVVRWERGQTEPAPWLRPKLAKALGVSPDRLEELLAGGVPASAPGPAGVVPRQLPAAVADFTGRAAELRALTRILDDVSADAAGTVVISAIGGTAGVGKTALAMHWAHQVAQRFPDGQLHVNLRGYDQSGAPATPEPVMRGFLEALGVPPERIPPLPDAQADLYRSQLAGRKMLILLDNARDEQQVRPLLPASPASLVLVTSRSQLSGLAAADGARVVTLDVLTHAEAVQLLTTRLGVERAAAEPAAVDEIAGLCACLPLALAVAAARAAARPRFPLTALAAELADSAARLDALDAGDPGSNVRAVFSWSTRQLSGESARMFALLGLHPGPDIAVVAAASLAAIAETDARRSLAELARAQLIAEHVPGRYAFHDLLRAYAAEQASNTISETDRREATGRALDHYLHTAARAALLLNSSWEPVALAEPRPGAVAGHFADQSQATAWFEADHQVLLAMVTIAAASGLDVHAWQLPWAMSPFVFINGHFNEWIAIQRTALAAATRIGDAAGQAIASRLLGNALITSGQYDQVVGHYANSVTLYRQLGNALGEAKAHQGLAAVAERQGRYRDALGHAQQAIYQFRAIGRTGSEAEMLNVIGWNCALMGEYEKARDFCRQSLALNAEVGDQLVEGNIWDSLGYTEHQLGNFAEAAACYRRAIALFRQFGDRFNEALTVTHLGDTREAAGEKALAQEDWRQALVILEDLQHPSAGQVRAKLAGVEGQP